MLHDAAATEPQVGEAVMFQRQRTGIISMRVQCTALVAPYAECAQKHCSTEHADKHDCVAGMLCICGARCFRQGKVRQGQLSLRIDGPPRVEATGRWNSNPLMTGSIDEWNGQIRCYCHQWRPRHRGGHSVTRKMVAGLFHQIAHTQP